MTRKERYACMQWSALAIVLYGGASVGLYVLLAHPAAGKLDGPTGLMLTFVIGSTLPLNVVPFAYRGLPALRLVRAFVHGVVGCTVLALLLYGFANYAAVAVGLMGLNELLFRHKQQRLAA